jgi:hypothetical protein
MDAAEQPVTVTVQEDRTAGMVTVSDRKLTSQGTEALKDVIFGSVSFPLDLRMRHKRLHVTDRS